MIQHDVVLHTTKPHSSYFWGTMILPTFT